MVSNVYVCKDGKTEINNNGHLDRGDCSERNDNGNGLIFFSNSYSNEEVEYASDVESLGRSSLIKTSFLREKKKENIDHPLSTGVHAGCLEATLTNLSSHNIYKVNGLSKLKVEPNEIKKLQLQLESEALIPWELSSIHRGLGFHRDNRPRQFATIQEISDAMLNINFHLLTIRREIYDFRSIIVNSKKNQIGNAGFESSSNVNHMKKVIQSALKSVCGLSNALRRFSNLCQGRPYDAPEERELCYGRTICFVSGIICGLLLYNFQKWLFA